MERKNKKKLIQLKCSHCETIFDKELREHKRQIKKNPNYKFYCSLKCCNESLDEFSPFRSYVSMAKKNAKQKELEFNLDVEYLKQLWEDQKGECFYTNLLMNLAPTGGEKEFKPDTASLDRKDSSKGYIKGNVRFVCLSINYAKNSFSEDDFINFLTKLKHF